MISSETTASMKYPAAFPGRTFRLTIGEMPGLRHNPHVQLNARNPVSVNLAVVNSATVFGSPALPPLIYPPPTPRTNLRRAESILRGHCPFATLFEIPSRRLGLNTLNSLPFQIRKIQLSPKSSMSPLITTRRSLRSLTWGNLLLCKSGKESR